MQVFPDFTVQSLLARVSQSPGVTDVSLSAHAVCRPTNSALSSLNVNDVLEVKTPTGVRPVNVLFPLPVGATGLRRKEFVDKLRGYVTGNTVPVSAVACYYFADAPGWCAWLTANKKIGSQRLIETCDKLGINMDFMLFIGMSNDEGICEQCTALLGSLMGRIEGFTEPLCRMLKERGVIALLGRRSTVLHREEYLPSRSGELLGTWNGVDIAEYWLLDEGLTTKRNHSAIFKYLAMTDTIKKAREVKGAVVVIGGASGTGKTCALMSIGTSERLHIVVPMKLLVADFNRLKNEKATQAAHAAPGTTRKRTREDDIQDFAQSIQEGIRRRLEDALKATPANEVKENTVKVVLHVDEAGSSINVYGQTITVTHPHELRLLIHAQEWLSEPALVKGSPSVWLAVEIAIAGTGLEGLYSGTEGSIASKFQVVNAATVTGVTEALTEKIVKAHLAESSAPREALDDVVEVMMGRPEISRVAATNYRLLSYCLMELVRLLQLPAEPVKERISDRLYEQYTQMCGNRLGEGGDVPLRRCYEAALPYACMQGAENFIAVNGLSRFSRRTAKMLIRVAHVAYLLRAVVVPVGEVDMETVSAELTNHGFTPVTSDTHFAQLLEVGAAAGVFTVSKTECQASQLPSNYLAVGATDSKRDTVVAIPLNEVPVHLSPAYVMLPRLLDGTLFTDGSPGAFELVASALLCRSLHALGLVCGGCDRWGLHAAMCGPEYVLRQCNPTAFTTAPAAATNTAPAAATNTIFIHFTRAVEVPLGKRLHDGVTEMTILLKCARALREIMVQDGLCTQALDAAIANKDRGALLTALANVMFVLIPAGQSASADAELLCIGSEEKRGYLTGRQDKREEKAFDAKRAPDEVKKGLAALGTLETLATGTGPSVTMDEFFFNFTTGDTISGHYKIDTKHEIHYHGCVRQDAFFLSSGKI